jgi:hypothetical protein
MRAGHKLPLAGLIDQLNRDSPWEGKHDRAIWRGVATGLHKVDESNWDEVPRAKLCLQAKEIGRLDARISGYVAGE